LCLKKTGEWRRFIGNIISKIIKRAVASKTWELPG
jgi:hypothetical protein